MRQLGHGQTVMYFAPTEVHQKISDVTQKRSPGSGIQAVDVVRWAIDETCASIRHSVPLWASQGLSYHNRQKAWLDYSGSDSRDHVDGEKLLDGLKEPESQTLEEMYGIKDMPNASSRIQNFAEDEDDEDEDGFEDRGFETEDDEDEDGFEGRGFETEDDEDEDGFEDRGVETEDAIVKAIWTECERFSVTSLHGVRQQEEQEREVAQETEQERAVERPPPASAEKHSLSPWVADFVRTGKIRSMNTFVPAAHIFDQTSAETKMVDGWPESLLATRDFTRTIKATSQNLLDDYLRRIIWVLSSHSHTVIISPYEANELIPLIRQSPYVRLHVYSPKVTKDMGRFDEMESLSFSAMPRRKLDDDVLRTLNLLAGQLCLSDLKKEYMGLCAFLGLYLENVSDDDKDHIDTEGGFMSAIRRQELGREGSPFEKNPVGFVKEVMKFRRKGQDYLETHMGKLLSAVPLTERDFDM
jgi:hypothetical protein